MSWGQMSTWGHLGSLSQKVIFTKNASSPSEYVALTRDLCIRISLTPSTKVISLNIHPGSFGVTGVKRSFLLKCYNSSMLYSITMKIIHVHQLETLYLRNGVKCPRGVIWGHWGQKVIFTKLAITRPSYIA